MLNEIQFHASKLIDQHASFVASHGTPPPFFFLSISPSSSDRDRVVSPDSREPMERKAAGYEPHLNTTSKQYKENIPVLFLFV